MTSRIRNSAKIALSASRSAWTSLTHPRAPRTTRNPTKSSEGGFLTLSGALVLACLSLVSVGIIKAQVVDPLRATAQTAVTTLDQGLDCLANPDTLTC